MSGFLERNQKEVSSPGWYVVNTSFDLVDTKNITPCPKTKRGCPFETASLFNKIR